MLTNRLKRLIVNEFLHTELSTFSRRTQDVLDRMNAEIDETLKRIESTHKSVVGVLVCNKDGVIIRSTFNDLNTGGNNSTENVNYSSAILQIVDKAKEALKESDELTFVKVKTKKHEFIVVPDKDFMLITLLNPSDESIA